MEIFSEGTEKRDLREKFSLYERFGVREYWIVDPETEIVQVFRFSGGKYPAPVEFWKNACLVSPRLPGLSIPPVRRFFFLNLRVRFLLGGWASNVRLLPDSSGIQW